MPFTAAALMAATVVTTVTGSAVAAPSGQSGGGGVGDGSVVNLRDVAGMADVTPSRPAVTKSNELARPALPSRPTTGTRPALPAKSAAGGGVTVDGNPTPTFGVMENFEGIAEGASCFCEPPDVNAAAGPTEIAEIVNTFLQVTDKNGAILCNGGVTLNRSSGPRTTCPIPGSSTTSSVTASPFP
jgi:hypothetical protein